MPKTESRRIVPRLKWTVAWFFISAGLALIDPTPIFIDRQEFDRAANAWRENPTPGNEAVLRAEQRKNRIIRFEARAFNASVLFGVGAVCYMCFIVIRSTLRFRRAVTPSEPPPSPPMTDH